MALVVLTSASGSPGVTTSALGLALVWPRPVLLVEGDPTGGSAVLAGYLRGAAAHSPGLLDLAWAYREGSLAAALPAVTMPLAGSSVSLLPGVRSHTQSRSLRSLWEPLTATLKGLEETGQDVIVDAGRLGLEGSPEALIDAADLTLLTMRSDLVALSGARSWADTLSAGFTRVGGERRLGCLLVGEGRPYGGREISKVLQLPITASLAWDPKAAGVFAHGTTPPRRFDGSVLPRSLRAARTAIETAISAARSALNATPTAGVSR